MADRRHRMGGTLGMHMAFTRVNGARRSSGFTAIQHWPAGIGARNRDHPRRSRRHRGVTQQQNTLVIALAALLVGAWPPPAT